MKLRKLLCGVMAALTLITAGGSALAAETYQGTVLPMAKSEHEIVGTDGLTVRSDGSIDYLLNTAALKSGGQTILQNANETKWFHSPDGGKNWTEADMGWYEPTKKKYFRQEKSGGLLDGKFYGLYRAWDGAYYFIMETHGWSEIEGNNSYGKTSSQVFRLEDGRAEPIPSLTLADDPAYYRILSVEENGDLVLFEGVPAARGFRGVRVYDGKTGRLKQELQTPLQDIAGISYADGVVSRVVESGGKSNLTGTDINTGKQTFTVPIPGGKDQSDMKWLCTKKDGTVFLACGAGLYRLASGSGKLDPLVEAGPAWFGGQTVRLWNTACTDEGTVYITAGYEDGKGNLTGYKLHRFSPKQEK